MVVQRKIGCMKLGIFIVLGVTGANAGAAPGDDLVYKALNVPVMMSIDLGSRMVIYKKSVGGLECMMRPDVLRGNPGVMQPLTDASSGGISASLSRGPVSPIPENPVPVGPAGPLPVPGTAQNVFDCTLLVSAASDPLAIYQALSTPAYTFAYENDIYVSAKSVGGLNCARTVDASTGDAQRGVGISFFCRKK